MHSCSGPKDIPSWPVVSSRKSNTLPISSRCFRKSEKGFGAADCRTFAVCGCSDEFLITCTTSEATNQLLISRYLRSGIRIAVCLHQSECLLPISFPERHGTRVACSPRPKKGASVSGTIHYVR